MTDGTIGFQNLSNATWDAFYDAIKQRCTRYQINELVLVLDGDIVDMIRSSKWAQAKIYPWERERTAEFSVVVNDIIEQHSDFFNWLRTLESKLKQDAAASEIKVKIITLLGNHDKELFCDQAALKYFYEKGLGREVGQITEHERRVLGRMYGDENLFLDFNQAPYLPFYYGDTGFRFFTTHGQWCDANNCRQNKAQNGKPGWKAVKGWLLETWQQLKFSPFIEPCFGDTVAAGVLSTFIYKVKVKFTEIHFDNPRLISILDELDLYRPTYAAISRILTEAANMRDKKQESKVITIIGETLYECIIDWLSWDFTYQSSPPLRRFGLKLAKRLLEFMKSVGHRLEIKGISLLMRILTFFDIQHKPGISLAKMKKFPSFMPVYRHY